MSLIDHVRRTIERERLAQPDTRVVAALSGGPDSMALLPVLCALHEEQVLTLVGVAHLNHGLRDEADADAQFCAGVAQAAGLPFFTERVDVRAMAALERRSIEDAAHGARVAFFERAAERLSGEVVAVGHTRNDQAETVLLRLFRGAGTRGLSAMHPRSGIVIRPLLDCSRDEVQAFLKDRHLVALHDSSNDDLGIPRNRIRAEVLPLLEARFNPRIVDVLASAAELARADQELLQGLAEDWIGANARNAGSNVWQVEAAGLLALPRAVSSRALFSLMRRAGGVGRLVGFEDVRRAWDVVEGRVSALDAPGQRLQRVGADVVLSSRPAGSAGRRPAVSTGPIPAFCHPLPVPGEVVLPEIGCVMSAEVVQAAREAPAPDGLVAVVPQDRVAGGLAVRNRRPGDRLMPTAAGHRKLQDVLVDRKVPRTERDRVPIVVDRDDRIVWVAGVAADREFRVTDSAQAVVVLRLKGVGGSC
jgi:tRNA(Ile)-lysidine synthase